MIIKFVQNKQFDECKLFVKSIQNNKKSDLGNDEIDKKFLDQIQSKITNLNIID